MHSQQTSVTKALFEGKRVDPNPYNGKPYRTASQREQAKATAEKGKDGTYRSSAPVTYHPAPKK